MNDLDAKRGLLLQQLRELRGCVVAFSGGVDSAVVAKAAMLALGDRAVAVTAVSPSLASGELQLARQIAQQIGIRHDEIETREMENPAYVLNHFDRCFHCKTELYSLMETDLSRWNASIIVNGANLDDLGDHRPGMRAAGDHRVASPLADCGFTKEDVRRLARDWDLPVADKPATPCLSSRIAYGEQVTVARLERIDQAEQWLRSNGFADVRVRLHGGELARLEVNENQLDDVCREPMRSELTREFVALGFKFVTVDLQGRRSGSLNTLVPIEELERGGESKK